MCIIPLRVWFRSGTNRRLHGTILVMVLLQVFGVWKFMTL